MHLIGFVGSEQPKGMRQSVPQSSHISPPSPQKQTFHISTGKVTVAQLTKLDWTGRRLCSAISCFQFFNISFFFLPVVSFPKTRYQSHSNMALLAIDGLIGFRIGNKQIFKKMVLESSPSKTNWICI